MSALVVVASIGIAACGSSGEDEQGTAASDAGATTPAIVASDEPSSEVIGTGNVGGPVVDPQPHPIDGIDIAESDPEQLIVRFTSGDPNCTAADASAAAVGNTVEVSLTVGITEDALSRSCLAGDVEQSVTIALDEGLDGRDVSAR